MSSAESCEVCARLLRKSFQFLNYCSVCSDFAGICLPIIYICFAVVLGMSTVLLPFVVITSVMCLQYATSERQALTVRHQGEIGATYARIEALINSYISAYCNPLNPCIWKCITLIPALLLVSLIIFGLPLISGVILFNGLSLAFMVLESITTGDGILFLIYKGFWSIFFLCVGLTLLLRLLMKFLTADVLRLCQHIAAAIGARIVSQWWHPSQQVRASAISVALAY